MSFFENLFLDQKDIESVSGLTSELKGLYVYNIWKKTQQPILFLTSTLFEANQIYQAISDYTDSVNLFPMDEFLTSEALAISPEFKSKRLDTLDQLILNGRQIVVTDLMGFLRFLPTKENFKKSYLTISKDMDIRPNDLLLKLYQLGYDRESVVSKTGEMAVRGFVVDIFPIFAENPIRIEFWGDTIDSIRIFDENNQLTKEEIDEFTIKPNTEFITTKNIEEDKKQRDLPKYEKVTSIVDYLVDPIVVFDDYDRIISSYETLLEDIEEYCHSTQQSHLTTYMNSWDDIPINKPFYFKNNDNIALNVQKTQIFESYDIEPFPQNYVTINKALNQYLKQTKTVIVCLTNRYQINKILDTLENVNFVVSSENEIVEHKINLIVKSIQKGFIFGSYVVISESEFFNRHDNKIKYKNNFKYGTKIKDITKLSVGDYIVHSIHGIGRYMGLKTLVKNGIQKDYLTIEYKGGDKLYIPVEKIDFISKFSSSEGNVPKLNKLGSSEWAKTKLKVRKRIENIAGQLLELYAKRQASVGFAFDPDSEEQLIFEGNFPYQETTDQLRVMEEIKKDMESPRPMDRLVCGDVGYGKTELAFRAMFKAVASGKQAAYLCPTTILSNQHFQNALGRFQDFPINIRLLNRFVSPKRVKETLLNLKKGTVDIVIGTHRLLSNDVEFHDLGLLVIDEEQRFGVKHKEKIKEYKNNVDILTLSATPIPRTLQMSMTGVRNLSLLETPPVDRLPVQTYVLEENQAIIKDAIYKELSRNGQVFILYNYVEDMDLKKLEIERLIPEAKIVCAHGQMSKIELEDIMQRFIAKEFDVLLCTTIIETGIDIPNVNTLLIIDADRFGLSQLYQIRGRVGRSNRIAYCYLMYHPGKTLSDVANKRLQVIKEFTELGSGFSIAMRDLSLRGAGDILGSEQAGYIDSVGIDLYLQMLNEEVAKLNGQTIIEEETIEEQPLIDVTTAIDDQYVDDHDLKIEIHRKINSIDSYDKLLAIKAELEDRFGHVSDELLIYMHEEWFEKLAHSLQINKVKQTNNFIELVVPKSLTEKIDGEKLFMEVMEVSRMFRFGYRGSQLLIILDTVKLEKHFIYYLIELMNIIQKAIM